MIPAAVLGLVPAKGNLLMFLLHKGIPLGLPWVKHVVHDPTGIVSRIGDTLVWNGAHGQQLVAGLASLGEGQSRIEQVVNHIESVQLGVSHSLGVMHMLSIATLGATSLSGAYMVWRLQSLNKRFDKLSEAIKDVDDNLDAQNKAHLNKSVQKLREFEDTADVEAAAIASGEAQDAANIYGELAWREASRKEPRLPVLNYRSRCYILALVTELQSRLLLEQEVSATITRINDEQPRLQSIAKSTFDAVIRNRPEVFLRGQMSAEGVTLDLLTELYQQARLAGAVTKPEVQSAAQLFEHCRTRGIAGNRLWRFSRSAKHDANQLRYLMASLEEINRINGMRLLMSEADEKKASIPAIRDKLRQWWNETATATPSANDSIMVYSFA